MRTGEPAPTPADPDGFGLAGSGRPRIPGSGPQSIAEVLAPGLARRPDGEAVVSRWARLTYAGLDDEVARAADVLAALGVRTGDRVACSMGNHAELVVAFLASMRLGAIWVGVNTALAPPEMAFVLADAEVSLFLGDRARAATARSLGSQLPFLRRVVEAEPGDPACEWASLIAGAGAARDRPAVDPFGPAAISYTSGTTGRPKGVVHSQHNLLLPGAVAAALFPDADARPGVCLPLTILNLVVLGPLASFQQALPCVLMDRVDAPGIATWVRDERISAFASVPTILHDLLTHPDVAPDDLSSLVKAGVGGANCPEAFRRLYEARFGMRVTTSYGLTEAPTVVTREDASLPAVPGASGRAEPQLRVTIRDEDGVVQAPGQTGEICVEPAPDGPFAGVYTPMLGYWRRPEATAAALRDGVLRTGDVGHLSPEGDLFVTDRKNDLILRGGANVYPAEVERVLHEDERVAACAVLGVPDERLGERVAAVVVVATGAILREEELRERCLASLSRYKVPDRFVFAESLPRNAMGKVVKRELRALFE